MNFNDAAKLWSMIYRSNFYDTKSDTQRKWVEFATEAKDYFKLQLEKENAAGNR